MKMEFKRDQRVLDDGGNPYRVESGPWRDMNGCEQYLVQRLRGTVKDAYALREAQWLTAAPPEVGSRGRLSAFGYLHTLHYIDDEVALLWRVDSDTSDHKLWVPIRRPQFDESWQAAS